MRALEEPWSTPRSRLLANTPIVVIATVGLGWLVVAGLAAGGWVPRTALGAASIAATHGGLLAVALAWGAADGRARRPPGARLPPGAPVIAVGLVGAGALAAALDARAAVVYLAVPAWLAMLAFQGRLVGLGLGPGVRLWPILIGVAVGALLGGHLLWSASQTLGYPLRGGDWKPYLGFWGYDLGANVVSAELFFRGALFNRLQRRWSFAVAAALATAVSLLRYLADPLLPRQVEVMTGALFYLTMLAAVNCWLLWSSGSLVPGLIAAVLFFVAYRALAIG